MSGPFLTLHLPSRAREYYASGDWRSETIYQAVAARATQNSDKVAVREFASVLTYRELLLRADRLADQLHALGLRPGDRVAFWGPSSSLAAVTLLACSRDRLVVVPSLHRDHTADEVATLMASIEAAAIIVDPCHGSDASRVDTMAILGNVASLRAVIDLRTEQHLWLDGSASSDRAPGEDPDCVSYIAFTSGTTGQPKAVMHSDNTLMAAVRAMIRDWSLSDQSVIYSLSPLSHNLGFGAMVLALTSGAELIVHDLPRGVSLFDRIVDTGTTFLFGVPTHAVDLLAEMTRRDEKRLGSVTGFRISGAAVARNVVEAMMERGVTPQSGYGMTEAGSHHYTRPSDPAEIIASSSGRPYEGFSTRILSQDGHDLPAGEVGQICLRGPSVTLGYLGNQRATGEAFTSDGWLQTGDMGWQDAEGNIRITGRKKDIVVRGGHNIFPAKVESLAASFDGVDACAVIPVPDDRLGEKACLVIAPDDGAVDPLELLKHLDESGLSRYDMPEYFARVPQIPLLASGKPAKIRLVEAFDRGELSIEPIRFRPQKKIGEQQS